MPRGPTIYNLPPGTTPQNSGDPIPSAMFNAFADDVANTFNTVQPIEYGGTNAATAVGAIDNLMTKGADIPSATTTDIWASTGQFVHVTGTTTITSFGATSVAGNTRVVVFDGILTLTHNGATLALPGNANITTAAGDIAIVVSEGGGVSRVINYERRSLAPITQNVTASFTPTVVGLTSPGVGTYTTQTGAYTRIGNVVTFKITLVWTAHTGTGLAAIDGLPFTATAGDTALSVIASNYTLSPSNVMIAFMTGSTSRISLAQQVVGGGIFTSINIDTAATLYVSGSYQVA